MRTSSVLACGAAVVIGVALAPAAASAGTLSSPAASATATPTPASTTAPAAGGSSDPDTTVTFAVTSGALTITAPTAAGLGSGAPGALGAVTVTDNRALLSATWTASASSTSFTTGSATTPETIPATDAGYAPGPLVTTGTITATPHTITLSGSPQAVVVGSAGTGNNTASWDPTVSVAVPASAVFGTYTGTIAHSVS